jgi:hypothetical protein
VVLFDLFGTLGSEVASSRQKRLADFKVYPASLALLAGLRERARLGVFTTDPAIPADRLTSLFAARGLIPPLDAALVLVAASAGPHFFESSVHDLSVEEGRVVVVSPDAHQRADAMAAGMRVAPHPALVAPVLRGEDLHLVRLRVDGAGAAPSWAALLSELEAVPVLITREPGPVAYAITPRLKFPDSGGAIASSVGIEVLGGPDLVADCTLVLLQITRQQMEAEPSLSDFLVELVNKKLPLLEETPSGFLVALPSGRSIDELHPPPAGAAHGHSLELVPDLSVLSAPALRVELRPRDLDGDESRVIGTLDAAALGRRMAALLESPKRRRARRLEA